MVKPNDLPNHRWKNSELLMRSQREAGGVFAMAADVKRDEFQRLETRVDVVEGEVEGEKLVTRHILEQTRRNGDDLAAIKTRLFRLEDKLDGVDLKTLVRKVDVLDRKVDNLARNLPNLVGEAVRGILDERDRK